MFLPRGVIDAGLATDRRVDLREQRRRHLDEVDAALVRGGGEPGDVADDAAAEGDDRSRSVEPGREHRVVERLEHRGVLELLAIVYDDRHDGAAGGPQRREQRVSVQRR